MDGWLKRWRVDDREVTEKMIRDEMRRSSKRWSQERLDRRGAAGLWGTGCGP